MWRCRQCGEEVDDAFDACWKCGAGENGIPDTDFQPEPDDPAVPDLGPEPEVHELATAAPEVPPVDALVTIATYDIASQAEVDRLALEEEGIRTFLADDNLVTANWLLSNAVGGVKLQVAASCADQAQGIFEAFRAMKSTATKGPVPTHVTFVCEACGKGIAFPGERCGRVETCPHCGAYVDVPDSVDASSVAQLESRDIAKVDQASDGGSDARTTGELWLEVLAILCLAYVPSMFSAVSRVLGWREVPGSFIHDELWYVVYAFQVSLPLLVIMALGKDPWPLFGIVRPRWITDALAGCAIWIGAGLASLFARSLLPAWLLEGAASHVARGLGTEGVSGCLLLLLALVASGFAEELMMRGYLIPRLERLLRSTPAAVLLTSLLFASYHIYLGFAPVIECVAVGLVYGVSFCLLRRLWPLCLAHVLHNFFLYL
jgi:membrane protease YdiL (CAAX protease family)